MSALFLLIGISLVVASGFLIAFIVSVKKGQYDDSYTPSVRMLFDDTVKKANPEKQK
ncbi:MAG: cbb3-type cytochrome oxidase assembly protein CcoS [Flavobacteriales bacterium]